MSNPVPPPSPAKGKKPDASAPASGSAPAADEAAKVDKKAGKAGKARRAAKVAAKSGGIPPAEGPRAPQQQPGNIGGQAGGASSGSPASGAAGSSASSGQTQPQSYGQQQQQRRQQGSSGPSQPTHVTNASAAAAAGASSSSTSIPSIFTHLSLPKHLPHNFATSKEGVVIHPLILEVALRLRDGSIRGGNARCISGLIGLKQVIVEYVTPSDTTLQRNLLQHLSPQIAHLTNARPMPIGLGNAIRWLKQMIIDVSKETNVTDFDVKERISVGIDEYIRDRITLADEVISSLAREKIKNHDVILTFGRSSVVQKVILEAHRDMSHRGESFTVIVVDSAPLFEGRALLRVLTSADISCTYTTLLALPKLLPRATLVLLGASALLANGAVYARSGTASIAELSRVFERPVIVCCETYKFGEKIVLNGVVENELGNPTLLRTFPIPISSLPLSITSPQASSSAAVASSIASASASGLLPSPSDIEDILSKPAPDQMQTLNLTYDVTSPMNVTAVCTEYGFIPPSSVPTVLSRSGLTNP